MYKTRKALTNLSNIQANEQDIVGKQKLNKPVKNMKEITNTPVKRKTFVVSKNDDKENVVVNMPNVQLKEQHFDSTLETLKYVDVSVQCSKSDEDMLTTSSKLPDEYWHIMINKRKLAINDVINENKKLHDLIEVVNNCNEELREENKELLELLDEVNCIKTMINEQDDDSGLAIDITQNSCY